MPKGQKRNHNWDALKAEWLQTDLSLNQFRIGKDIAKAVFYPHVEKGKWTETKRKNAERTLNKINTKVVNAQADKWEDYRELYKDVKKQLKRIVGKFGEDEDKTIPIRDLKDIAETLGKLTSGLSFLDGGPTARIETRNLHGDIVRILDAQRKGEIVGLDEDLS